MSTGAARRLTITDHDSYIEVENHLICMGLAANSYIVEGSTTSYDASRYRYGTGSST